MNEIKDDVTKFRHCNWSYSVVKSGSSVTKVKKCHKKKKKVVANDLEEEISLPVQVPDIRLHFRWHLKSKIFLLLISRCLKINDELHAQIKTESLNKTAASS